MMKMLLALQTQNWIILLKININESCLAYEAVLRHAPNANTICEKPYFRQNHFGEKWTQDDPC